MNILLNTKQNVKFLTKPLFLACIIIVLGVSATLLIKEPKNEQPLRITKIIHNKIEMDSISKNYGGRESYYSYYVQNTVEPEKSRLIIVFTDGTQEIADEHNDKFMNKAIDEYIDYTQDLEQMDFERRQDQI